MRGFRTVVGLLLLSGLPLAVFAQTPAPAGTVTEVKPAEVKPAEVKPADAKTVDTKDTGTKPGEVKFPPAEVSAAKPRPIDENDEKTDKTRVRLGDIVIVSVANDKTFRLEADSKKDADSKKVTLFLNGQDTGLEPIDSATDQYVFRLARTDDNKKLWERLLEAPFRERIAPLHVSIGYKGDKPLPVKDEKSTTLQLEKMNLKSLRALFWIVVLVLVLYLFGRLVRRTDILRNGPTVGGVKQAYSIGRSQMAWWLFIVIISYVTIWMITGNRDTVSQSTLILLGISSATALGAVAIDASASSRVKTALDRLNAEITTLQTQATAEAPQALIDAVNARIAAIQQEKMNIVTTTPSVNWFMDVLTDDSGAIALHRFQVLLWTFVLGVVFLVSVAHVLSMPDFNTPLLTLMGISSTTYLGFKFPTAG